MTLGLTWDSLGWSPPFLWYSGLVRICCCIKPQHRDSEYTALFQLILPSHHILHLLNSTSFVPFFPTLSHPSIRQFPAVLGYNFPLLSRTFPSQTKLFPYLPGQTFLIPLMSLPAFVCQIFPCPLKSDLSLPS